MVFSSTCSEVEKIAESLNRSLHSTKVSSETLRSIFKGSVGISKSSSWRLVVSPFEPVLHPYDHAITAT
jgi:hypothetical protein